VCRIARLDPKHKPGDLVELKELSEAGKVTPVIDRTVSLSDFSSAIRYLNTGHASGKVVIALRK